MKRKRRVSLQVKLAVALTLVVLTPLLVSAYLVDQLGKVAANFASSEAAARQRPMADALATYRDLFDTTKRLHAEIADRLARQPDLAAELPTVLAREPGLVRIALERPDRSVIAQASRPLPGPAWREKQVDREVAQGTAMEHAYQIRLGNPRQRSALVQALEAMPGVQDVSLLLQEPTVEL